MMQDFKIREAPPCSVETENYGSSINTVDGDGLTELKRVHSPSGIRSERAAIGGGSGLRISLGIVYHAVDSAMT